MGTQGEGAVHTPRAEAAPDLGLRLQHGDSRLFSQPLALALPPSCSGFAGRVHTSSPVVRHCCKRPVTAPSPPGNFFFDFPSPSGTLPPAMSLCCPIHLKLTVQKFFPKLLDLLKPSSYFFRTRTL